MKDTQAETVIAEISSSQVGVAIWFRQRPDELDALRRTVLCGMIIWRPVNPGLRAGTLPRTKASRFADSRLRTGRNLRVAVVRAENLVQSSDQGG